jgi:molybdopterin converting factor small subunit
MSIVRLRAGIPQVEFSSKGDTLGEVVREIGKRYKVSDLVLTSKGRVRPWARIMVNGRSQEFIGGLNAKLSDGDRIALIYSFPYHENV